MSGMIIKSKLSKLDDRIVRLNVAKILVIMFFVSYLSQITFSLMLDLVQISIFGTPINQEHDFLATKGLVSLAIVGCLIAPLLETLLSQYAPIRICQISLHWSRRRAIFISALLFGVLHNYNIGYVVAMFGTGLVFAYAFTVFDKKGSNPVLWLTILHTARNVVSLIFWYFRQNPHSL